MIYYFSHARTALYYGLKNYIDNFANKSILIPDYICEDVLFPIKELNINYVFYELNDSLEPNWDDLDSKVNKNIGYIIMVHYFGKNQDISKFLEFTKIHNLILIEDNAHGYGGLIDNKLLGDFGNFSIVNIEYVFTQCSN